MFFKFADFPPFLSVQWVNSVVNLGSVIVTKKFWISEDKRSREDQTSPVYIVVPTITQNSHSPWLLEAFRHCIRQYTTWLTFSNFHAGRQPCFFFYLSLPHHQKWCCTKYLHGNPFNKGSSSHVELINKNLTQLMVLSDDWCNKSVVLQPRKLANVWRDNSLWPSLWISNSLI